MSVQDEIAARLRPVLCDDCLAQLIEKKRNHVNQEVLLLCSGLNPRFRRAKGRCNSCGRKKKVTWASGPGRETGFPSPGQ